MSLKRYLTEKHSVQSSSSELEKLEKTHKSELRMISTAALKFRSKFIRVEDPRRWQGETEACNVRMYETHFPGFCYLKDGKYRRKVVNNICIKTPDPVECSATIKALLFTDSELDVRKVMCLHLLGTHVQNRRHIQRKDGRVCSFIKSQIHGSKRLTLQAVSERTSTYEKEAPSIYDKMLPRYVLDVRFMDRILSNLSLYTCDTENLSDEDLGKRRRFQVPVYINNDIKAIISSVVEALEGVNSPKLRELLLLSKSPEELRNMLAQDDVQEFIIDLAGNQLVTRATAYDFTITHPVFDKIPDTGTMETVAQVLEFVSDSGLRNMLQLIRKTIARRYEELVMCNVIPGRKRGPQGSKGTMSWNLSKTSFISGEPSTKTCSSVFTTGLLASEYRFNRYQIGSSEKLRDDSNNNNSSRMEIHSDGKTERNMSHSSLSRSFTSTRRMGSRSLRSIFPLRAPTGEQAKIFRALDEGRYEESSSSCVDSKNELRPQQFGRFQDIEITKYDLKNLSNSQRILLGLKVASMKNRPINMHQFESRKRSDVNSVITTFIRNIVSDAEHGESANEDTLHGLGMKRARKSMSRNEGLQVQSLGSLTRGVLSNFRHEIATSENKKRVKQFLNSQL